MSRPVLAVHGGAGGLTDELREREAEYREAIEQALDAGAQALAKPGEGAVEAVCAAVIEMESFPLFNAGYGSALCADGSVEMSASVMRGRDRAAGAVALMARALRSRFGHDRTVTVWRPGHKSDTTVP